ncbi:MAG: STAS domain-containing protein [Desulfuromonadales bacterium]
MEITDREQNSCQIISVKGRLDASTAPQLQTHFEEHISAGRHFFILNLQGVDYLSSGGLRVLLIATKKARAQNGGVVLTKLHPFVEDLITMAGFNKLIPTAASEEDAIALLAEGATV